MINLEEAKKFLSILDPDADSFTFQTFDDRKKNKRFNLARIIHGKLEDVAEELKSLNLEGAGVFVTVNETNGLGREETNIEAIRAVFMDKDDGDVDSYPLKPSMIIEGGRGPHAYYVLNRKLEISDDNKQLFKDLQERISAYFKSDRLIDLPRVMRLPGFMHMKDPENPRYIKVKESNEDLRYDPNELLSTFPAIQRKTFKRVLPKKNPVNVEEIKKGKGKLLSNVENFLNQSWSDSSGDNNILIHSIANIKKNGYTMSECMELLEEKGEPLDRNTQNQVASIYINDEKYPVDPFIPEIEKSNSWLDFLINSELYVDFTNFENRVAVNPDMRKVEKFDYRVISKLLGKKVVDNKLKVCRFSYNPSVYKYEYKDFNGFPQLNTYNPPFWLEDCYFGKSEIPLVTELPKEYDRFFNHLFDGDKGSIEYTLDWMASAVQGNKNIPILTLVGSRRGIGKNVFVYINRALHGADNFEVCNQQIISKEFNNQMLNKTLIHFDEVSITKEKEFESIKAYTNPIIAVEGKGSNTITTDFFANIILTNNLEDSLQGVSEKDDRQFSIPKLTKNNLLNVSPYSENSNEINRLYSDKNLIQQLAYFLYNRSIDINFVNRNFKSVHYYDIIKASKTEWHKFLLEDIYPKYNGKIIPLSILRDCISRYERVKPGRIKMELFFESYPNLFKMKRLGSDRKRCAILSKNEEVYSDFQNRVSELVDYNNENFVRIVDLED